MRLKHDPGAVRRVSQAGISAASPCCYGGARVNARSPCAAECRTGSVAAPRRGGAVLRPGTARSSDLLQQRIDRVWIALHGPGGEDGTVQGALEFLGFPIPAAA